MSGLMAFASWATYFVFLAVYGFSPGWLAPAMTAGILVLEKVCDPLMTALKLTFPETLVSSMKLTFPTTVSF